MKLITLTIIIGVLAIAIGLSHFFIADEPIEETRRGVEGTGSMRPLFEKRAYPDMQVVTKDLQENDTIYLGRIYVYTKSVTIQNETTGKNKTEIEYVGHRLLGIYNVSGEIISIFKGDNNIYVDEPVYREQIIEEVVGIDLE